MLNRGAGAGGAAGTVVVGVTTAAELTAVGVPMTMTPGVVPTAVSPVARMMVALGERTIGTGVIGALGNRIAGTLTGAITL